MVVVAAEREGGGEGNGGGGSSGRGRRGGEGEWNEYGLCHKKDLEKSNNETRRERKEEQRSDPDPLLIRLSIGIAKSNE
ncbi:hypothetical protein ACH5RR_023164 [Cinchona calisaya]|uniref:Uncharacterized protein n=1 Tax=Cinchona calisaya TaxID=153742 RepID=A0ABD2ZD15_9GENT